MSGQLAFLLRFGLLLGFARALFVDRGTLATENLALRQQLSVLKSKSLVQDQIGATARSG
jgi:hypothetical protein